jgi:hypothetical protein
LPNVKKVEELKNKKILFQKMLSWLENAIKKGPNLDRHKKTPSSQSRQVNLDLPVVTKGSFWLVE